MHLIGEIKGLQSSKRGRNGRRLLTIAVQLDVAVTDMVVQGHELARDGQLHQAMVVLVASVARSVRAMGGRQGRRRLYPSAAPS
jgi:hypothetical protein